MSMERELKDLLKVLGHPVVWGSFSKVPGMPCITLNRISTVTNYSLKERSSNETARIQVNLYSENYGPLIMLAPQVSNLLTGYRSDRVIRCKELSRRDSGSESGGDVVRLQMLDFRVRYRA